MDAKWLIAAALNGFIAVAAGAFGAHYLKSKLAVGDLSTFETAVRYQMYHALVFFAVAGLNPTFVTNFGEAAGWCFLAGIILFSGSLYGLSLLGWRWLGPITPIGGLLLLVGWLFLILHGVRMMRAPSD